MRASEPESRSAAGTVRTSEATGADLRFPRLCLPQDRSENVDAYLLLRFVSIRGILRGGCVDSRYFKRRAFDKTNQRSLWGLAFGSPPLVIHYRYRPECNLLQKRMPLLRVHPPYPCSSDYSHFVFKPPSVSLHGLSIQRSPPRHRRHRRSAAPD